MQEKCTNKIKYIERGQPIFLLVWAGGLRISNGNESALNQFYYYWNNQTN